jgi:hypothetical protein
MIAARRLLSPDEASLLVGAPVPPADESALLPPARVGEPLRIVDAESGAPVLIVTKMTREATSALRTAVRRASMGTVARMSSKMPGDGRTFGYAPRNPIKQKEACGATTLERDQPEVAGVLARLAGALGREFGSLLPARAAADRQVVGAVLPDWLLDEDGLWTSGVINRTATLPYHRDGANFHTWSAMPSVRMGVDGGRLHLPEYGLTCRVDDADVTWFAGRDLVHGVTPMRLRRSDGYRYTVVYYALSGMVDCRSWAEETAGAAALRTVRERKMAADLLARAAP